MSDPRSLEGHAAMAMKGGLEGEWIDMQANTFLNWVNQNLSTSGKQTIDSLMTGFADGLRLAALVECLQQRKLGRLSKPLTEHHCLENINVALRALAEDNVRLVNIGAEDIIKENEKLILGLVWHMILKYQIGKTSKIPSKKLMLYWVQAVLHPMHIGNFTTDWNSGIALHGLLEYCEPGTSTNWRQLHHDNGLPNLRSAMVLANAKFNIPQIMSAEDLNSPRVDELSAMTYLSYFMRADSPGYRATLRWVNRMLESVGAPPIDNFTSDWASGSVLQQVLAAMGASVAFGDSPKQRVQGCYDTAQQQFNVNPVLTADEMVGPDVDYLGVMAYAARLQQICPVPGDEPGLVATESADAVDSGALAPRAEAQAWVDTDAATISPNRPLCVTVQFPAAPDKSSVSVRVSGPQDTSPYAHVDWQSDTQLQAAFTPVRAGEHLVEVLGVACDPVRVDVGRGSLHDVRLEVPPGLRSSRVTESRLDARCLGGGEVRAELKSPAGRLTDVPVKEVSPGLFELRLLGSDPGEWLLYIWVDGEELPQSPVSLFLLDSSSVTVEAPQEASSGQDALVVVRHAAGAKLTAHVVVDGETVPCFIEDDAGDRRIHFTPSRAGVYSVTIHFGDEEIRGSPFEVRVKDFDLPTATVASVSMTQANKEASFVVHTANAGPGELEVDITGPSGASIPSRVMQQRDEFAVNFTPVEAGRHSVAIGYGGQPISGSPFLVNVYDASRLRTSFEAKVPVGETATVTVDASSAGEAPLQLRVVPPSGSHLAVAETRIRDGVVSFEYSPSEPGAHELTVFFNGAEVDGCPYSQEAVSAEVTTASGEGLEVALLHRPAHFFVDPRGQKGDLFVQVDGPTSISACNIEPTSDGLYKVSYTPEEVGHYSVVVRWNDAAVPGSPFSPLVLDLDAIRCVAGGPDAGGQLQGLVVGKERKVEYDTSMAGPGRLSAKVEGPRGQLPTAMRGDSFTFTPDSAGQVTVKVWFAERPVPGTPYRGVAVADDPAPIDHTKVILSGRGLKEARVGEEAAFIVDGGQAGPGRPVVRLVSASSDASPGVSCLQVADNKYRCTYVPEVVGSYLLHIGWSERPLRGSPFRVSVLGQSDASRIVCSGEGLRQGVIGQDIKSLIDTRHAGVGDLTAHCVGPTKPAICELFDHQNGTYTLSVKPQEPGKHQLVVEFNGSQVPGSPFALRVAAAPDASRVRVYGPGVEHGAIDDFQSRFVCETKGAGAGQLTVRIRGPKGAFRVEMEREYQKDRTIICRYDPAECGEYQLHIKWSGTHVPGSPFSVHIFRTQAELNRFLEQNPGEARGRNHNGAVFDF